MNCKQQQRRRRRRGVLGKTMALVGKKLNNMWLNIWKMVIIKRTY